MNSKQYISQLLGYAIQSQISHRCYCRKYNISPHKLSARFSLLVRFDWSQISSWACSHFSILRPVNLYSLVWGIFFATELLFTLCLYFCMPGPYPRAASTLSSGSWAAVGMGKQNHPTHLTALLWWVFFEVLDIQEEISLKIILHMS